MIKITITPEFELLKKRTKKRADAMLVAIYDEFTAIKYEIDAIYSRDPAAKNKAEVLLLYSGLHAILIHRLAHYMNKKGLKIGARFISQFGKFLTGIEIHPGAEIGRGVFIDHGAGVVIGETAVVGDNCTIYQGVTLGGTGKESGKRHPTLGKNVMVGAGAKLLGSFTVGDNSKIAAGAVVLCDVPDNSTAVGIPAKVVRKSGKKVDEDCENDIDLDQVHIPDPVSNDIASLSLRIAQLEKKIDEYEKLSK